MELENRTVASYTWSHPATDMLRYMYVEPFAVSMFRPVDADAGTDEF